MGVGGSFQDVIVDTSIFVHQLTHPLRSRVVLFTTLNSFQLFKKKEVLPCHQEGKKGLMSCKNYANGMEDYTLGVVYEIFFLRMSSSSSTGAKKKYPAIIRMG